MRFFRLIRDLFLDGHKAIGLLAPLLSICFTVLKALDVPIATDLRQISYAWAFLPLLLWLFIAYVRRWAAHTEMLRTADDEAAFAIKLEAVDLHVEQRSDPHSGQSVVRLSFNFRNRTARAIRFNVRRIDVEGVVQTDIQVREGILPANSADRFFSSFVIVPGWSVGQYKMFSASLEVEYGSALRPFSRVISADMHIEVTPEHQVTCIFEKNTDTPVSK